jgi:hypothetical protein
MLCTGKDRFVRQLVYVCSVIAASLVARDASATGDQYGVVRTFNAADSPYPWPQVSGGLDFHDFRFEQYKAECVSPGTLEGISADKSGTLSPHAVFCQQPQASALPFDQSDPETVYENDETFSTTNSVDYGHHPINGDPDWDYGYYKGECPVGSMVTGIAQSTDTHAIDTVHCSSTVGQMCGRGNFAYLSNKTCRAVAFPSGGNPHGVWDPGYEMVSCNYGEVVSGVSTDTTNHHPHAILCCGITPTVC